MINLILDMDIEDKKNACKGLYWRGATNYYWSSHNSMEVRKSLRFLKRKSCKGCKHCAWVFEYLQEQTLNDDYDPLPDIENGKLYTFEVHSSQGFEDLYPEIDAITFIEVNDEKTK